MKMSN